MYNLINVLFLIQNIAIITGTDLIFTYFIMIKKLKIKLSKFCLKIRCIRQSFKKSYVIRNV